LTPQHALSIKPAIASVAAMPCTVCGENLWTEVGSGQDFEYETCSNTWSFHACRQCGHVQIDPLPAPEMLGAIYPSNYYSYAMKDSVHPLARWAKRLLDKLKFRGILGNSPRAASYLDVGCGDGRYLELMIERGADPSRVFGVELDAGAVKAACSKGLHVSQSRIEDAAYLAPGQFDLITMFHVIEHVARPDLVVARLNELLAPGGMLAIETPNFDALDARLAGRRYWGGYHIPRHWHVFTPESLQRLLMSAGFSVRAVRYQPGHAFWLWTLHHWLKYERSWPRLAAFCHPLRNVPLLALVTAFDLLRAKLGQRTSAMLVLAVKA